MYVVFVLLEFYVAPARERGLKSVAKAIGAELRRVAPARERGLKWWMEGDLPIGTKSRSRKGAWIEISVSSLFSRAAMVAPARERGLKC